MVWLHGGRSVLTAFAGLTFQGGEVKHPKGRVQKGRQNLHDKTLGPSAICGLSAGAAQVGKSVLGSKFDGA